MSDIVLSNGRRDRLQVDYYTSAVNDALPLRVQCLKYYSQNVLMSSVTLKYGANYTTVTDLAGRSCTYQFNNGGNTTAVYNDEGQALYGKYARDVSSSGRANQLVSSSRLQDTVTGQNNAGRTNLLQNADLSDGARCWSLTPVIVSRDTESEPRAKLDSNAIEIVGSSTANCEVYQNYIPTRSAPFDQYSFGVWVKSNSVPLTEDNRKCGIKVTLYRNNNPVQEEYVPVNPDCREWQFISGSIIADEPYDKVRVSCVYDHNANSAYFDGIQLFRETFASKCEYDGNGNITKITDISGNVTAYEYVSGRSDISKITLPGGGEYSYNYDGNHRVTETVSATGVKTNYSYDAYGNCTGAVISSAVTENFKKIESSTSYTPDGNMTASVTGGDGNTVSYTNDTQRSLTTGVTDPLGNTTLSTYDSLRRLISSSCGNAQVNYTYSDDLLTQLSHTNTASTETVYTFVYGRGGLMTSVKVGNTALSTNTYNSNTYTLAQQTFGNGDWWKYSYDRMDTLLERYTNISSTEGVAFEYQYNSKGLLCGIYLYDITLNGTEITSRTLVSSEHYSYDVSDRLVKVEENNELGETVHSYNWEYDSKENITSLTENINGTSYTYSYTYDADSRPAAMNYGSTAEILSYDALGRTTRSSVRVNGHEILRKNYTYKDIDAAKTTTQLFGVSYVYNRTSTDHMYYYDANGNIIMVKTFNSEREPIITRYSYNSLNELIWEYNPIAGKAWRYNYDFGGNILQKVEYAYVDGVVSGTGTVINYTYGDGNWKDKLTNYNGQSIIYDTIGNPTKYRGMDMSWQGGRQLAGVGISDTYTISFEYNEAGLRTKKIVSNGDNDENRHKYYWANGKLSAEICEGSYSLFFHYDANGDILGFSYKVGETATEYYYIKNLQGDVLKVITASGDVVAEYSYNAWGQILSSNGAMADINPIRYRGYYYDTDLALYYLQSRYYDPEVGRFVNADDLVSTDTENAIGANMFAYCKNNPVMLKDESGNLPEWATDLLIGVAVIAVVAVVATVTIASAGATAPLACAAAGALEGAVTGAVSGAITGAATGAITHRMTTGTWEGAGTAALNGAASGFKSGAIIGAVTGALTSPYCFVAGTAVITAAGIVAIENISVGDKVYAWNEETGQTELKTVVETYENETTELTHVFAGGEEIISTPSHPFYSPIKGWTAACRLRAGDILVTVNGEYVVVEQVQHELLENPVKVYNFQVEDDHTYYVSETGVLVHNVCRAAKEAQLPTEGKIRYIPPENMGSNLPKTSNGGFLDRFGNVWLKGPSRTLGEPFEWDVQLSRVGKAKLGWLSRDGKHINVSLKGVITHR